MQKNGVYPYNRPLVPLIMRQEAKYRRRAMLPSLPPKVDEANVDTSIYVESSN